MTAIPDFITPNKVKYIEQQEFDYRGKNLTAKNLNDSIRIWLTETELEMKKMNK